MPRGKVWAVSHIVAEDDSNPNRRQFLVHWQGFSSDYDTWEPLKNLLPGSKDIVREWDKQKKVKVKEEKAAVKQERREYLAEMREKKGLKRSASQISLDERKVGAARVKLSQTDPKVADLVKSSASSGQKVPGQQQLTLSNFMSTTAGQRHLVQAGTPLIQTNGSHLNHVKRENTVDSNLMHRLFQNDTSKSTATKSEPIPTSSLTHSSSNREIIDTKTMDQDNSPTLQRKPPSQPRPHNTQLYLDFLSALDNISGPPVWVVNDIDDEPCPPLVFKWIEEYHLAPGVPIRDETFSVGCSCPGEECDLADPQACECLDDSEEKKFAYDQDGLIHHPPGTAIVECNNRCGCGRTCPNRVVQRGRRMPLEIFKTHKKGWGVRTCRPIPKGMFICRYIGEVITEAEAEARGAEYDRKGITYLFDLDFFRHNHDYEQQQAGSPDPVGNLFCVDAMRYGNVSRFFNHSCNPNVAIYTVVRSGDNRVYDLAIFALRPIKPYEELCFDYKTKKGVAVKQTCYCGERNCSGWLFGS